MKAANHSAAPRIQFSRGGQKCVLFNGGGTATSIFALPNVFYGTVRLLHPHRQITYEDIFQMATWYSPLCFTTGTQLMARSNDEGRKFGYHGQGVLWGPVLIPGTLQVSLQKRQRVWAQQCGYNFCCPTFHHNSRTRRGLSLISRGVIGQELNNTAWGYPVCAILLDNTLSSIPVDIRGEALIKRDHMLGYLDRVSIHAQTAMAGMGVTSFKGNNAPNRIGIGHFTRREMLCVAGSSAFQRNIPQTFPRAHDIHIRLLVAPANSHG